MKEVSLNINKDVYEEAVEYFSRYNKTESSSEKVFLSDFDTSIDKRLYRKSVVVQLHAACRLLEDYIKLI